MKNFIHRAAISIWKRTSPVRRRVVLPICRRFTVSWLQPPLDEVTKQIRAELALHDAHWRAFARESHGLYVERSRDVELVIDDLVREIGRLQCQVEELRGATQAGHATRVGEPAILGMPDARKINNAA